MCVYTSLYECRNVHATECVWSEQSHCCSHLLPCLTQGLVGCCPAVHTALAGLELLGIFLSASQSCRRALGLQNCTGRTSFPWVLRIQAWVLILTQQVVCLLSHLSSLNPFFLCTCAHRNTTRLLRGKISGMIKHTHHAWLLCGSRGSNSGSHACKTHILQTEPSLQPLLCQFFGTSPMRIFIFLSMKEDLMI